MGVAGASKVSGPLLFFGIVFRVRASHTHGVGCSSLKMVCVTVTPSPRTTQHFQNFGEPQQPATRHDVMKMHFFLTNRIFFFCGTSARGLWARGKAGFDRCALPCLNCISPMPFSKTDAKLFSDFFCITRAATSSKHLNFCTCTSIGLYTALIRDIQSSVNTPHTDERALHDGTCRVLRRVLIEESYSSTYVEAAPPLSCPKFRELGKLSLPNRHYDGTTVLNIPRQRGWFRA